MYIFLYAVGAVVSSGKPTQVSIIIIPMCVRVKLAHIKTIISHVFLLQVIEKENADGTEDFVWTLVLQTCGKEHYGISLMLWAHKI